MTFQTTPPIDAAPGDTLECEMVMERRTDNQRLLQVKITSKLTGGSAHAQKAPPARTCLYRIE